ncbi:Endoplasmic reticulum mannosyl-oligosaccharide 1,2-alpha-mannosidase [Coemansia sp. RSA 2320]|nr:Endoplasmic reticulum mannosyl-oligosaccharide 1,2-alpha-mannosidase [Coemansia sp. RSA 2320]
MAYMSISLRKLFFVLLACLSGLYLLSFYGHLKNYKVESWVDTLRQGELPWKLATTVDAYRNSELTAANFKRQQAVREATSHAWKAYRQFAWGQDELRPVAKDSNQKWGGWAITLVDSLDTLKLMSLDEDYEEAKEFVRTMQFNRTVEGYHTQLFEMTIRALGGLLGAYELDDDPMLLKQAQVVGDSLAHAFRTADSLPAPYVDVNGKALVPGRDICIAEAGTLQLEFKKLSQLTGNDTYAKLVDNVSEILERAERKFKGLYPSFINVLTGEFNPHSAITVGAYADSFYEYLLKQYILHAGKEPKFKARYITSVEAIKENLLKKSTTGFSYIGLMASETNFVHEMEHLACFYPGLLALGSRVLDRPQDLEVAKELARTCYHSYTMTPTGLGPDVISFDLQEPIPTRDVYAQRLWDAKHYDADGIGAAATRYILRPETIETLFILYRITGDPKYQEWGWNIFLAIEKHAKIEHGYSGLVDVYDTTADAPRLDSMESFFLAETLKYLYLLFSPTDLLSLDEFVLNTEAHPLRIMK